jgi:hypothetical protein
LHHFYKIPVGNENWIRRNRETTPKRSWISIFVEASEEETENYRKRLDEKKIATKMKKREGVGAYKEELCAIINTKKALAAEQKEEEAARWSELKFMENEK